MSKVFYSRNFMEKERTSVFTITMASSHNWLIQTLKYYPKFSEKYVIMLQLFNYFSTFKFKDFTQQSRDSQPINHKLRFYLQLTTYSNANKYLNIQVWFFLSWYSKVMPQLFFVKHKFTAYKSIKFTSKLICENLHCLNR